MILSKSMICIIFLILEIGLNLAHLKLDCIQFVILLWFNVYAFTTGCQFWPVSATNLTLGYSFAQKSVGFGRSEIYFLVFLNGLSTNITTRYTEKPNIHYINIVITIIKIQIYVIIFTLYYAEFWYFFLLKKKTKINFNINKYLYIIYLI